LYSGLLQQEWRFFTSMEGDGNDADPTGSGSIAHPSESFSQMMSRIRRYDNIRLWWRQGLITAEEYRVVEEMRLKLWCEVEEKLKSDPSFARWTAEEDGGSLPLLQACERSRAPSSVVRALIDACPDGPRHKDCLGRSPLFSGCCNLEASAFHELLCASPEACSEEDDNGLLPHHCAAVHHGADLRNLWLLCKVYPDGVKAIGRRNNTALHELCRVAANDKLLVSIADCAKLRALSGGFGTFWDSRAMDEPVKHVVLLWARLQLLLMATYHGKVPQSIPSSDDIRAMENEILICEDLGLGVQRTFSACHAAAGCGAPVPASRAVMSYYPKGVRQADYLGRLPLHLAAARGHTARFYCDTCFEWKSETNYHQMVDENLFINKLCVECFEMGYKFAEKNNFNRNVAILFPSTSGKPRLFHLGDGRHFCCHDIKSTVLNERRSTVELLLNLYPEGALHRDNDGFLPIHHAARSGDMDGCVLPLFQPNPECLEAATTGGHPLRTPFQIAVETARESPDDRNVDVVFRMLLLNPAFILCGKGSI